jgi:DNA-binding XRE family transcriptional regulator
MTEETWGECVHRRRKELGLNHGELAIVAGVSRGTVRNIELGHSMERNTRNVISCALGLHPKVMHKVVISPAAVGPIVRTIIRLSREDEGLGARAVRAFHELVDTLAHASDTGHGVPPSTADEFRRHVLAHMPVLTADAVWPLVVEAGNAKPRSLEPGAPAPSSAEPSSAPVQPSSPVTDRGRVSLGFSYSPAAHNAVKQLAVSAEIVLMGHITALTDTGDVDADLVELLLALVALPVDVRGRTDDVLIEIAMNEEVRRG